MRNAVVYIGILSYSGDKVVGESGVEGRRDDGNGERRFLDTEVNENPCTFVYKTGKFVIYCHFIIEFYKSILMRKS